ncbi:MAG TPA: FMN-binding glutamate synthase family protein, partial [Bacillota bacterium]|nr:FMN-binding glutamate synthase family protein [Bacillota bacterium]
IDTSVTIGPLAKRPLEIDLPIMIGGMAYGFGPSLRAKLALAKGVDLVNTATNTGVGPFLPEERKYTKRLIIQYNRGNWGKEEEVLRQADMIEVQLGYGALGPAPVVLDAEDISEEFREYMKLRPGTELKLDSTLDGITTKRALTGLVDYLKKVTNGVPVGVKIGATHYLEKELDILVGAGVDFVTIDGAEGGINFGPAILADDCGLPTLPALCRAAAYFQKNRLDKKVSLIISGGLFNPGQFLKAIALGADAVYIGTIAMLVIAHLQVSKTIPWEPPTELVYERGKFKDELDIEKGALNIANYLKSCKEEMVLALRSMGRTSLAELTLKDLCALTPDISSMTRTELGLYAPMLASEGTND